MSRLRRPTLPNRQWARGRGGEGAKDSLLAASTTPAAPVDAPASPPSPSRFRRLWHLLWLVPLLGSAVAIAAPSDRLGPPPQILAFEVQPAAARAREGRRRTWRVEGSEEVPRDQRTGGVVAGGWC